MSLEIEKLYEPSKWQQEFHDLPHDEALGAGSAGPGKSLCLLMDCNERIVLEHERAANPSHRFRTGKGQSKGWALHLRRTFPMLEQTLERAHQYFKAIDPDVKWDGDSHTFKFWSGLKYTFGHCQKLNDWEKYQSNQYDYICFDELTQFDEEQYNQIKTRLRSSDKLLMRMLKVRAMSNPLARRLAGEDFVIRNPHWVRDRFVKPFPSGRETIVRRFKNKLGKEIKRTRIYLPASLYDNPDADFVAQYEAQLLDQPDHIRAAMLYGDWFVSPDSFFGMHWDKRIHVCDPFRIPDDWPIFRSMDWGYRVQGALHWYAQDPDGTLFVIYERMFRMKDAAEMAKEILQIEEDMGLPSRRGSRLTGPADHNLWEERGDTGKSKAEVMAAMGVNWVKASKKRKQRNAELLVARLRAHHKGTTKPGIVFFRSCQQAIMTLPAIATDPNDPNVPLDGPGDDAPDSVLYGCEYASRDRSTIRREEPDDFDDDDAPKPERRGNFGYYSTV